MGKIFALVIAVVSFFIAYRGPGIVKFIGLYKDLVFNDSSCVLLGKDLLVASEDVELLPNKNVIISAGDLHNAFRKFSNAKQGKIAHLDLSGTPTVSEIKMIDYPSGDAFHPHGIYLSQKSRLYVVNHVNDKDRIEVFKYSDNPPTLQYLFTLSHEFFLSGILNDIVEGENENEVYITRWLTFPIPKGGSHHDPTLLEIFLREAEKLTLIFGIPTTEIYRCTWTDSEKPKTDCTVALGYQTGANGITKIPNTNTYFLIDSPAGFVRVLSRQYDGSLQRQTSIELPHAADNVMYNSFTHSLNIGTITFGKDVANKFEGVDVNVPGSLVEVRLPKDTPINSKTVQVKDFLSHDGSKLSMISSGTQSGEYAILGSPFSSGVLVCSVSGDSK